MHGLFQMTIISKLNLLLAVFKTCEKAISLTPLICLKLPQSTDPNALLVAFDVESVYTNIPYTYTWSRSN